MTNRCHLSNCWMSEKPPSCWKPSSESQWKAETNERRSDMMPFWHVLVRWARWVSEIDNFMSTSTFWFNCCQDRTSNILLWSLRTMIRLTFRLNPFIFDAKLVPVAWRIIFRVVLSVGQVDDDSELRYGFSNVEGCMSGREKENEANAMESSALFYLSSIGRRSEMCCKEGKKERMNRWMEWDEWLNEYIKSLCCCFCDNFFHFRLLFKSKKFSFFLFVLKSQREI